MHSSLGAEGSLLREAQQVQEGDGKGGKSEEKRGDLAWGSAYEDIHLASVEQLWLCLQNVVVDRGRDQGNMRVIAARRAAKAKYVCMLVS